MSHNDIFVMIKSLYQHIIINQFKNKTHTHTWSMVCDVCVKREYLTYESYVICMITNNSNMKLNNISIKIKNYHSYNVIKLPKQKT